MAAFVEAELDKRHPERVQLREMQTADDYRAMWGTLERLWSGTVARAQLLPEAARHERVDDEWSFSETLRHLVFATDAWASRTILDQPLPYHRLGVTHTSYPPAEAEALGIDLDARPSFAEVLDVRAPTAWCLYAALLLALATPISNGHAGARLRPVTQRSHARSDGASAS